MAAVFDSGGAYAAHRPTYPDSLAPMLAELPRNRALAIDVGCGTGQFTTGLASHFHHVLGIDPSASQLESATPRDNVSYRLSEAAELPADNGSVDLLTVAQAAHWIDDLDGFYREARRVAAPGAVLALVSYGVCHLDGELDQYFQDFYWGDFHRFWDPRRRHVENGLADLPFPFELARLDTPPMTASYDLEGFLGYLGTWTAVKNARASGHAHEFTRFAATLTEKWGDPSTARAVSWPVMVRAGRINP